MVNHDYVQGKTPQENLSHKQFVSFGKNSTKTSKNSLISLMCFHLSVYISSVQNFILCISSTLTAHLVLFHTSDFSLVYKVSSCVFYLFCFFFSSDKRSHFSVMGDYFSSCSSLTQHQDERTKYL